MGSAYIQQADYATYGLPSSTTPAQIAAASTFLDAYLRRPDGLVWQPDATGAPGWMAAKSPSLSFVSAGAIEPGRNVEVTLGVNNSTFGLGNVLQVGETLIADRGNSEAAEPVVVISLQGNVAILRHVQFGHEAGATFDLGMACKQHRFMPDGRPLTTLAYTPIMRLLSGQGRYGYGRRGDAARYMVDEFNLLASLTHFGGPPAWESFPLENTGVDPGSGQVWVPAGVMLAYYSEVNLWYVAGWNYASLPDPIKFACAEVVQVTGQLPDMGQVLTYKAGDTSISRAAATVLSDDTRTMIEPYRARLFV